MRQDLLLTTLRPEDEAALGAFFAANDRSAVTRWFDPFPLDATTARTLTHHRGRDLYWAAWAGGDMVGFAMVRGWDDGHEHRAYGMLVDHRCRGRGIGMTMTALAVEELRRRGEEEVRARVHDDNDASLRVFEANGFEEVKRGDGRVILVCRLDAPPRGHGHAENPAGSSIRSAR